MEQFILRDGFMPEFIDKLEKSLKEGWRVKHIYTQVVGEGSFGIFWALMERS